MMTIGYAIATACGAAASLGRPISPSAFSEIAYFIDWALGSKWPRSKTVRIRKNTHGPAWTITVNSRCAGPNHFLTITSSHDPDDEKNLVWTVTAEVESTIERDDPQQNLSISVSVGGLKPIG